MNLSDADENRPQSVESGQHVKDVNRLLIKAERQIKKLQENLANQKQQVRELRAQAKYESDLAAEREELKGEVADLKGEIKELTRANREQAEKIEAFRSSLAKVRKPNGDASHGDPQKPIRAMLS